MQPTWYHNLAAHPDQVEIETAGTKVLATAEQLHGAERDEACNRSSPPHHDSRSTTTSPIASCPIIRLVPRT
jgi:F420H(2)-dependent quinone reductase